MPDDLLPIMLLILGICLGLMIAAATYLTEMRRMTRLLRDLEPGSNGRLTLGAPAPGARELAEAVNEVLDRDARERVQALRDRADIQRDLAALSHDIRTPLAGAKGYLQLAADEGDPTVSGRHLDATIGRIDTTTELLDALFAYTRSADPDLVLEREPVDVRPLVERALLNHYPAFEERGWEPSLTCADGTLSVLGDAEALSRIMENLLVNALRYGTAAPGIHIGGGGDRVRITVANPVDDPASIDTEHLFERFYQADRARGTRGSGLGLAVCRNLAEAMGASIAARIDGDALAIDLVLSGAPRTAPETGGPSGTRR